MHQFSGSLVAILNASAEHLTTASQLQPLQADSLLARSHRTQYPIVQGPMTRVSNTAAFARAVARGGALPMLALALMPGPRVRALLQETRDLLSDRAWGIGILGFVPQALREEQLAVVMEIKPPFALIAGGRPDQAMRLEARGIATYIHVPTSKLLELFLEQGARRFVFEGRECGGHVGPLSSFNLWESAIATLLERVPTGAESEIHVLFAGGIHDAASAAMVAAMAAPLAERGMRFGVLMGTAYLFTEEAVSCGAIVKEFQDIALACTQTINLETGPGHASRCAVTPFAREFYDTRRKMMAANRSPEEIKNTLEDLTLGRLRTASKGVTRNSTGEIERVDEAQQRKNGMYMIGQVVTLRSQIGTIAELHEDIARGSTERIARARSSITAESAEPAAAPADIAIIGIGTLLPQAEEPETFWYNILHKVNAITEIPPHRWDWHLYYDPDRAARDKVYSKWGGFLDEIPFDPLKFGIPPNSLKSIEPIQLLALETVRRALADAGYESGNFDREQTSIILGAGGGIADLGQQYALRSEIPRFVEAPSEEIWDRLPEWTEESFAGILLNVAAGRAANRFDFGGSNYTVDAACASSLAAISLAVKELESGRSNVAIAGGIDTVQSPYAYLCFSKTQALSPKGKARTFDKSADGIVISEGLAIVVLKRLADAERDGDRIYAVIKAVEGSSDGKALGLTAPLPAGQSRALQRTYQRAGFSPETLGLYEAHGTGTVAGDRAEVETITTALNAARARPQSCAIGSVKTLIGHTKCTAGVAGLVKVALALHRQVLPPHPEIENPLDAIADPASPVYLLPEARPWLARPDAPRRGAVSAFGFGGTNFHAVLEEYCGQVCEPTPGAQTWPWELFVMRAENGDALLAEVQQLAKALEEGAEPHLADLAYSYACKAQEQPEQPVCLAVVVGNLPQLQEALNVVLNAIRDNKIETLPPHIQLKWAIERKAEGSGQWAVGRRQWAGGSGQWAGGSGQKAEGKEPVDKVTGNDNDSDGHETKHPSPRLAFLFPGQGAQYPDMAREVALYFPEMREILEFADRQLQESLPQPLSQFIYPCGVYSDAEQQQAKQQLVDTRIAQPAIGTIEMGLMALMRRLNLEPAMVCGHSYGEYAALHWAGVLSRRDFLNLSAARGRVMATACEASDGAMAAVQATREELQNRLQGVKGVVIANHNAPRQTVISGEKSEVERVVDNLNAAGTMARMLPVAGAFHSALVASARTALSAAIAETTVETPQVPVYANATARAYPAEADGIRQQLAEHLISPVNFVGQIEAMYEAGARIFVEVGPKSILTNLTGQILAGKDYQAVALDGRDGLRSFLIALGTLATAAVPFNLTALYEQRDVRRLDLSRLVALTRKPPLSPSAWLVQGGGIRPQTAENGYTGKLPPFNQETAALEKAKRQREKISPPA
ncbi:MAG: beta-ketoacyl synthase N-terminal-like domain-containing protein, partial [Cyanobacteriota bacterium]|nr:beta-ketoacyl synthase N-terminal-like domain-containing protein [Cyanobacteriota bacterium]